eukprot:357850-Chlamydomonas_euryale.AAC.2
MHEITSQPNPSARPSPLIFPPSSPHQAHNARRHTPRSATPATAPLPRCLQRCCALQSAR